MRYRSIGINLLWLHLTHVNRIHTTIKTSIKNKIDILLNQVVAY